MPVLSTCVYFHVATGEQGWYSGESARLPPMYLEFDSRPRGHNVYGLSLLLVLAFAPRVFSGFSGFPPSSKTNISKFQFDQEFEGHGFISWIFRLLCVTLVKQSWLQVHMYKLVYVKYWHWITVYIAKSISLIIIISILFCKIITCACTT